MSAATDLTEELEPLRAMLAADGYELAADLSADGRTVVLDITATADACAECLAPADGDRLGGPQLSAAESSALAGREIDVRLPVDGHAGSVAGGRADVEPS